MEESIIENECPVFDSEAWKSLSEAEQEKCKSKSVDKFIKQSKQNQKSSGNRWNYIILGLVILTGLFYFISNWVRVSKGYFASQGWIFLDNFSWFIFE